MKLRLIVGPMPFDQADARLTRRALTVQAGRHGPARIYQSSDPVSGYGLTAGALVRMLIGDRELSAPEVRTVIAFCGGEG